MSRELHEIAQLLLVAMLWSLFVFPYHRYRTDLLRQNLYELRDSLFRYAASKEILDAQA